MKKRIGIVVLSRHITSLGGIGFYVASFVNATKDVYICDLIVDRPIKSSDIPFPALTDCAIEYSKDSIGYSISGGHNMFDGDRSSPEMTVNIIRSLMDAHKTKLYDALFINSFELIAGVKHSGLDNLIPTFAFTHDNVFYEEYPRSLDIYGHINSPATLVPHLCQVPQWKWSCIPNQAFMPMPTLEYDLIKEIQPKPEANTVLFNGTFRDIKRPKDFTKFCEVHQKKALIITNASGKKYFEEAFVKAGLELEVRTNIFGRDKIEFISRAEMMFHPASNEMFSYAVLEALAFCPVFVYHEKWSDRYPEGLLNYVGKIQSFDGLKSEHKNAREWMLDYTNPENIVSSFDRYLTSAGIQHDISRSPVKQTLLKTIREAGGISVSDYFINVQPRTSIAVADLTTSYKLAHEVGFEHSKEDTFFGKEIKQGLEAFF